MRVGYLFAFNRNWLRGARRVELVTVEAALFGCCPVLNTGFAPEWVDSSMAVLVSRQSNRLLVNNGQSLAVRLSKISRAEAAAMNAAFLVALRKSSPMEQVEQLVKHIRERI